LLRIHSRHVTKLYRGMTLLRWIIEVCEHQRRWYTAQADGQLPFDEPFDPAFIDPGDSAQRFPYWLSAPATQTIHSFLKKIDLQVPKGWTVFFGRDELDTGYRLSCLYFGDKVLWSKTAVRKQELDFPQYDLLSELDICEFGIQLNKFRQGEIAASSTSEFRSVFETFCQRFKVDLSHSMGAFPIHGSWDPIQGWRTRQ